MPSIIWLSYALFNGVSRYKFDLVIDSEHKCMESCIVFALYCLYHTLHTHRILSKVFIKRWLAFVETDEVSRWIKTNTSDRKSK